MFLCHCILHLFMLLGLLPSSLGLDTSIPKPRDFSFWMGLGFFFLFAGLVFLFVLWGLFWFLLLLFLVCWVEFFVVGGFFWWGDFQEA